MGTARFTQTDLAKYPFLKDTANYVKKIGLNIQDITQPEFTRVLSRSQARLRNAVLYMQTGQRSEKLVEILSFPVAILIAIATKNTSVKKRYALAEAKEAFRELQFESDEKLVTIAGDFDWTLTPNQDAQIPLNFATHFTNYLRNINHLHDSKWKLANRILTNGKVYLNKHDAARLLQEEIQRRIEKRLDAPEQQLAFPAEILAIAERINALAKEMGSEPKSGTFHEHISQSAFPPCILALHDAATKGKHLSHMNRFTLASFLLAIGKPTGEVEAVFKTSPDYNAQLTNYQVKHLESSKYKPPSCSMLLTHGVCVNRNDLCLKIRHPLTYYGHRAQAPRKELTLEAS